jgi:beta-lysine 5,6-aminomutase alpha subunit
MPEIAFMGAVERLDMMLNDAMYGILFRDINMERTLVDQNFSRMINAYAGIIINTGEDNYLTTADAFDAGPSVLASQFMNYHFAKNAGLDDESIGLGHAFEINPFIQDSISYELAMALMVRQVFPDCPIKYMPPTVHKKGDIFFSHVLDSSFNLVSTLTGQTIHLVGMLTEAIHTPLIQDRYLSITSACYMRNAAKNLGKNLEITAGGLIQERAASILDETCDFLEHVNEKGLFASIGEGSFAGVKRYRTGGRGREGVFKRSLLYFNPVEEVLLEELF